VSFRLETDSLGDYHIYYLLWLIVVGSNLTPLNPLFFEGKGEGF
jgi:hypothetical protein